MTQARPALLVACLCASVLAACDGAGDEQTTLTREELLDPKTCERCHAGHYREWASSMHAYAAEDPVFRAMNERGQREAEVGDFCVNCHAPMAVREGVFEPGMDIGEIPEHLRGVTCYFCHNVESVEGTHNNPLTLANDTTMRGGVLDPVRNQAHKSQYSPLHDGHKLESATLCGSCHDIVNDNGVHLERTFEEWQGSLYNTPEVTAQTCVQCHMQTSRLQRIADDPNADVRSRPLSVHQHLMPGIDSALTEFPDVEAQRLAIQCDVDSALAVKLCPTEGPLGPLRHFEVSLETVTVGHAFPSGAAQDRRLWVELTAEIDGEIRPLSGHLDDAGNFVESEDDLFLFRDRIFDADGNETHDFWEAAFSSLHPTGVTSNLLPVASMRGMPHIRSYLYDVPDGVDRLTARVRVRPMGLEVLDDLIATRDLDPSVRDAMPVITLEGSVVIWTAERGTDCGVPGPLPEYICPQDYACMLHPELCE